MSDKTIAGHKFDFWGRCTLGDCRAKLSDLLSRRDEWIINERGICHSGSLNLAEKNELEEVYQAMSNATTQISSSRGS